MRPSKHNTTVIQEVVARHLCCGCGTCVAVCPSGALSVTKTPAGYVAAALSRPDRCSKCGLCVAVCPGLGPDEELLADVQDPTVGDVLQSYWGWARDNDLCRRGASGGSVTALLVELARQEVISAAVLTRWAPDALLCPQAFVARHESEIIQAQKSKYAMVPVNSLLPLLAGTDQPVALVGLPCHVLGVHRLKRVAPQLVPTNILLVGLFCDRVLSFLAVEYLLQALGLPPEEVTEFAYKHKGLRGWPGDVYARGRDGNERFVGRHVRLELKEAFTPVRCCLCFDKLNVLSDIAFGDGYHGPFRSEGVSAILVRTDRGAQALAAATDSLELIDAQLDELVAGQGLPERQRRLASYAAAYRMLQPDVALPLPQVCQDLLPEARPSDVRRARASLFEAFALEAAETRAAALEISWRAVRRLKRWRTWRFAKAAILRLSRAVLRLALRCLREQQAP